MKSVKGVNITLDCRLSEPQLITDRIRNSRKRIASPDALIYAIDYALKLIHSKKK